MVSISCINFEFHLQTIEHNDLVFITRIIMVWILRKFLIMHQVFIQNNDINLWRIWAQMSLAEDVKLSGYWEAAQSYPFCVFPLVFCFRINTLSKNHIMKGARARNPMNKHQKAQMSFSKPFSPHNIFIIFMPSSLLLLSFFMSIVISLRKMKSFSWGVKT